MFDKLYQGFTVFASLAQIFRQLVKKVISFPPSWRNRIRVPLNVLVRQSSKLFIEWAKIQPTSAQVPIKYMLFQKLKTLRLLRRLPWDGRSANDSAGKK